MFYLAGDKKLIAVEISSERGFKPGTPEALFQVYIPGLLEILSNYVPLRDGQRFIVSGLPPDVISSPLTVVTNWPATLKR